MNCDELLVLLDRRVRALSKTRADLADGLELQALLIRVALSSARRPVTAPFPLPRERAVGRLRQGVPLLHDQAVEIDVHFAADLLSRTVNALLDREDPELRPRLEALVAAATAGAFDPQRLFTEAFVNHHDHLAEMATAAGADAELLIGLARHAVAPILRGFAAHLLPVLEQVQRQSTDGAQWQAGYCPICGAWPLLGEVRGAELAHHLRCGGCGAGWRADHMVCPYCANDDPHSLETLYVEGEQRFSIGACNRCRGFLKLARTVDPPPPELLALEDAASAHLDMAAIERGYHRPSGAGFPLELALAEPEWAEEL